MRDLQLIDQRGDILLLFLQRPLFFSSLEHVIETDYHAPPVGDFGYGYRDTFESWEGGAGGYSMNAMFADGGLQTDYELSNINSISMTPNGENIPSLDKVKDRHKYGMLWYENDFYGEEIFRSIGSFRTGNLSPVCFEDLGCQY